MGKKNEKFQKESKVQRKDGTKTLNISGFKVGLKSSGKTFKEEEILEDYIARYYITY